MRVAAMKLLLAFASLVPVPVASVSVADQPQRPNILFIFTDDHGAQAISAYGSTINTTPNIDRLAREGVRFGNCFCTNAICAPSRAVILTGKHSHINGQMTNSHRFDGGQQTFPKLLQRAGYQTAMFGKWHLQSDPTGFDTWDILIGQGPYYNPTMIRGGEKIKRSGYTTDIITDLALEWLEQRDADKPFLLMCQHKAPHRNWQPGPNHLRLYDDAAIPEPPSLFDDWSGRGSASKMQEMTIAEHLSPGDLKLKPPGGLSPEQRAAWDAAYEPKNKAFRAANLSGRELVRWKYQRYVKDYLRCVASVDDNIGRLLDYLDTSGLAENTVVVYSSDQGWFLGEHGWYDKRWIYEESLRMPLLVRWPGKVRPGTVNQSLVQNLDFAPTLLDIAGVKVPGNMQGRSLVPLLQGDSPADWRTGVYYHYYEYPAVHMVQRHYGVRTARHKLAHFYKLEEWEMYDLDKDPQELNNVYDDPMYAPVAAELKAKLKRLREQYRVTEQADADCDRVLAPRRARTPNIVIIFTDDQGYSDVGVYGARGFETPHLDRMAAEGIRFMGFYAAQPVCSASRAALLTGCYPNRIGIAGALGPRAKLGIHPDEVTLAELCKSKGYATAAFGKWHLGHRPEFLPLQHGFDEYYGTPYSNDMWPLHPDYAHLPTDAAKRKQGYPDLPMIECDRVVDPQITGQDQERFTTEFTDRAVKFIERNRDNPFFLYLAHPMPHVPLFVSGKFAGKSQQGRYGDVIMEIDWSVGQILEALKKNHLDQNTLVIFTSDNGPWLSYGNRAGTCRPLREGKGTTWEGGVRVPCIMRWPGRIPSGKVCDEPAMTIDIFPTVARLIGAELPAHKIDGRDIWPLMSAAPGAKSPHEALYFYYHNNHLEAVRSGKWKLILPHRYRSLTGTPGMDGRPGGYSQREVGLELYDLEADPGETRNLAQEQPQIVQRMQVLVERARADLGDRLTQREGKNIRPAGRIKD